MYRPIGSPPAIVSIHRKYISCCDPSRRRTGRPTILDDGDSIYLKALLETNPLGWLSQEGIQRTGANQHFATGRKPRSGSVIFGIFERPAQLRRMGLGKYSPPSGCRRSSTVGRCSRCLTANHHHVENCTPTTPKTASAPIYRLRAPDVDPVTSPATCALSATAFF